MSSKELRPSVLRGYLSKRWSPEGTPVLVIGDSILDIYMYGVVKRISPEAPVPIMCQQRTKAFAGGAANVAANIVGMGGAAHLISCVGSDDEGDQLVTALTEARISFDLVRDEGGPTTTKTRFVAGQNQLLRVDREESSPIRDRCEAEVIAAVEAQIDRCRIVVLSDYLKGLLTDRVLSHVIRLAANRGVPVVVDPKRRDFGAYRGADFLTPNRAELGAASSLSTTTDQEIERAASEIAHSMRATILVTRAEEGMSLVQPSGWATHMPTRARKLFDVTGAGDTVIAAFALGLASGCSAEDAMATANIAAAVAVSRPGTTVVLADELEAERSLLADDETPVKGALVDADAAARQCRIWKRQGLVIGFTNGCFDLLHPGHISLLREAAKACDRLVVGLNSDASTRRLKGEDRPVQTEIVRAAVLGAIEHVNLVVLFEEDTPIKLIEALSPNLLVKGADYRIEEIIGADLVTAAGGRVMTVDLVPDQSTTRLIASRATATKAD